MFIKNFLIIGFLILAFVFPNAVFADENISDYEAITKLVT